MEKDSVKRISVWDKISDYLMDISKYVLTVVIITSAFEELADVRWMMYLWGTTGAIAFFVFSIIITHLTNKTI